MALILVRLAAVLNVANATQRAAPAQRLWGLRRAARHVTSAGSCSPPATASPIAVDRLVKLYKTVTAVDGISFAHRGRLLHGAARRQRRRQDHHHRHDHGPGRADLRHASRVLGADDAAAAPSRAAPDEFRKPLCGHADAADGAAEPQRVRHALRRARTSPAASARWPRNSICDEFLDRPTGKLSAGQKTRVALAKSLINRAGAAAARRADRLARSRHRRLGARAARALSPRARRDRAARLAQHERGRAAVRARHHDEARPDRGRRHAGAPDRALRPQQSRGGVPRHRARHAAKRGRRRNERAIAVRMSRSRRAASARWCCATGICCARPGRACST